MVVWVVQRGRWGWWSTSEFKGDSGIVIYFKSLPEIFNSNAQSRLRVSCVFPSVSIELMKYLHRLEYIW